MNALDRLIDEKLRVFVIPEDDSEDGFTGIVDSYMIEDYYFREKNESIYVTVNVMPDEMTEDDDPDNFMNISLDRIVMCNQ
jgi:hypothetical protein